MQKSYQLEISFICLFDKTAPQLQLQSFTVNGNQCLLEENFHFRLSCAHLFSPFFRLCPKACGNWEDLQPKMLKKIKLNRPYFLLTHKITCFQLKVWLYRSSSTYDALDSFKSHYTVSRNPIQLKISHFWNSGQGEQKFLGPSCKFEQRAVVIPDCGSLIRFVCCSF